MNKKQIILWIVISAIIVALIGTGICIWLIAVEAENKRLDAEAITLKENLTVEFGKETKVSDFIQELQGELLEDSVISTNQLGEVQVPVSFKNIKNRNRKTSFTIQVVDTTPPKIFSNNTLVLFADTVCDDEHRVISTSEETHLMKADTVMICVSQRPSNLILTQTEGLEINSRGLAKISEDGATTRPGLFASGDVVRGAKTVVEAAETSKRVAYAMDAYLKSLPKD